MSTLFGADAEALERLATRVETSATAIGLVRRTIQVSLFAAPWVGGSAELFRRRWGSEYARSLAEASSFLREAAGTLRRQAAEQREASEGGSAFAGGALGARGRNGGPPSELQRKVADTRRRMEQRREELARREAAGTITPEERRQLERLRHMLEAEPPRQFLAYSDDPKDHRIIEVHGDLSTATKAVIHVPGIRTNLDNYEYRGHGAAVSMYDEYVRDGQGKDVVVISFMDYDVPGNNPADVIGDHGAKTGAPNLQALVGDLQRSGFSAQDTSVVAHSYGTRVVGEAMMSPGGLPVRKVIALGSPGMGAPDYQSLTRNSPNVELVAAGDLDFVDDRLYRAIGSTGGPGWAIFGEWGRRVHGPSPTTPGFGAHVIHVPGARGHEYFADPRGVDLITREAVQ